MQINREINNHLKWGTIKPPENSLFIKFNVFNITRKPFSTFQCAYLQIKRQAKKQHKIEKKQQRNKAQICAYEGSPW